jgi:hypothetical protein
VFFAAKRTGCSAPTELRDLRSAISKDISSISGLRSNLPQEPTSGDIYEINRFSPLPLVITAVNPARLYEDCRNEN